MKKWTFARRRHFVISIIFHALLLMTVYVFQGMIFPYLRLSGLVPVLLPIASTGVAVNEGRYTGGVVGIFAGILCDVSFNEPVGLFTIILTVTGILVGALADTILTRGFATFFLSCVAVLVIVAFAQMFPLLFFEDVPLPPLMATAFWQTLYSLLFTFPLWFPVRALGNRAQRISPSGRL
jgi:rod shape-determining protein MreD